MLYTINKNLLNSEVIQSYSENMILMKLPGIPVVYCDPDPSSSRVSVTLYCSLIKGFPILLTNGSTIDGQEITSTHLSFPKNGKSLKIHLNTGGLNGKIYCQRNDDEGYII